MSLDATRAAVEASVIASEQTEQTPVPGAPEGTVAPKEGATPETPDAEKKGTEGNDETPRFSSAKLRIREVIRERNQYRNERDSLAARLARLDQPLVPEEKKADLDYDQRETLRIREASRAERKDEIREQLDTVANKSLQATAHAVALQLQEANDPALQPIFEEDNFPLSTETLEFLAETDQAVAIAKHLVANRDVAKRLEELTSGKATRAQLREADRILLGLEARARAGVMTQPRKATQAPNPGTTLKGGSPPSVQPSLEEIDNMDDYMKRRLPELRKRA